MTAHVFDADDDVMTTAKDVDEDGQIPTTNLLLSGRDKSQIAEALLNRVQRPEFRSEDDYPVIFDQGSFWRWSGPVWERVRHEDVRRDLMKVNTWARSQDGKLFPVSNSWCKDIIGLAEILADREGFFERSHLSPGIALKNAWLEATKTGIEVGENKPSRRCRYLQSVAIVDKDDAECPKWLQFLEDVFMFDHDKQEKIDFLQTFLGACVTGQAHVYDRAVMLLGQGANGKSVFCDVVEALFPEGSVTAVPPQDMSKMERNVALSKALLNLVTDIPTKDLRDVGAFKQIVSGDPVEARRLYSNPFRFRPTCGHLFSANSLPSTNDYSNGFFRRWVILEFNRNFQGAGNRPRNELVADILTEKSGIMVWALQGAVKLMANGSYFIPKSHLRVEQEWRNHNDQVRAFIDECVHRIFRAGERDNEGRQYDTMTGEALYDAYKKWARLNGLGQLSNVKFAARMKTLCGNEVKRRIKKGVEWGVELRDDNIWASGAGSYNLEEEPEND